MSFELLWKTRINFNLSNLLFVTSVPTEIPSFSLFMGRKGVIEIFNRILNFLKIFYSTIPRFVNLKLITRLKFLMLFATFHPPPPLLSFFWINFRDKQRNHLLYPSFTLKYFFARYIHFLFLQISTMCVLVPLYIELFNWLIFFFCFFCFCIYIYFYK